MISRADMRQLTPPTDAQIGAFTEFLSGDHSWYKHLPLEGRGEAFVIYLDPNVHTITVNRDDGTRAQRHLREESDGLSRLLTVEYEPGDVQHDHPSLTYTFSNTGTENYRNRYCYWRYWNWAPPDLSTDETVARAQADLGLDRELIETGLVYLRGTVSGRLLRNDEEDWEQRRSLNNGPTISADWAVQLQALRDAMLAVRSLIWDNGMWAG